MAVPEVMFCSNMKNCHDNIEESRNNGENMGKAMVGFTIAHFNNPKVKDDGWFRFVIDVVSIDYGNAIDSNQYKIIGRKIQVGDYEKRHIELEKKGYFYFSPKL